MPLIVQTTLQGVTEQQLNQWEDRLSVSNNRLAPGQLLHTRSGPMPPEQQYFELTDVWESEQAYTQFQQQSAQQMQSVGINPNRVVINARIRPVAQITVPEQSTQSSSSTSTYPSPTSFASARSGRSLLDR